MGFSGGRAIVFDEFFEVCWRLFLSRCRPQPLREGRNNGREAAFVLLLFFLFVCCILKDIVAERCLICGYNSRIKGALAPSYSSVYTTGFRPLLGLTSIGINTSDKAAKRPSC